MSSHTLERGSLFAGYAIERELAQGGMATVHLAEDLKHHRPVAVKLLRPEFSSPVEAARFLREIAIAATLTHPNILPLHDSGNEDGQLYYVMPYVEGGSLRQHIEREGPLAVPEAVRIIREVADALAHAHDRGVVHRDIKPENILMEQGHPVVADFGVARALASMGGEYSTDAGIALGTPAYMSPEQASGEADVDHRSDQYALACVLYELLAGHPPFAGSNTRATLARQVAEPPLALERPDVPGTVRRALERALAKAPADRFPSVRAFAGALLVPAAEDEPGPSIAVLPFVNLSGTPEDEYFAEGMADEIITALARIEGLRVASHSATVALKDKQLDIRAVGERLNVAAVLEGSVRRAGVTLRVTARLVNSADGHHLWTERFDRTVKDVFAIHDDIAANIARALRVVLHDDGRHPAGRRPTSDLEAYDFYLRGRQFLHQRRKKSALFAQQMFERAIQRDPAYARAWAGIADACSFQAHYYQDEGTAANLEHADAASLKALALDPDLPEAHAARGLVLSLLTRFDDAEAAFRRAMELDPRQFEARYFYARTCFQRGDLVRALELFEAAGRVRDDHEALYFAAQTLTALGRVQGAAAAYRRALPVIERHLDLNPDDGRACTMAAVSCSRLGDRTRALAWGRQATAVDPEDANVCYNVACLMALEGEGDQAIELLSSAFRVGFARREWVEHDPDLQSLRDDPRFQALLREKEAGPETA